MKPKHLNLDYMSQHSFSVRRDRYPKHQNNWHYHEQIELVMINKGAGSLYIGDVIIDFVEGNCIIIGSNIPHFWLFHDLHPISDTEDIDCVVLHFYKNFAGSDFFNLPELILLNNLIESTLKGIFLNRNETDSIRRLCDIILESNDVDRLINLLQILKEIQGVKGRFILSDNYSKLNSSNNEKRMIDVINYIRDNYTSIIALNDLSNVAKMTKNSFCRYFKKQTGKSPTQFVNELRIAHACRLLKNTKMSLKEISYDSGFNNFVSFHKTFKSQMQISPLVYRKTVSKYG